jgi:hypothetical protein
MRYLICFLIFSASIFFSCSEHSADVPTSFLIDSTVGDYLKVVDSSYQQDTSDLSHKVLRAYYLKDSAFFKELKTNINHYRSSNWHLPDSCIVQAKLQETNAEEAYRFIYTPSFGQCKMNITVSYNGDSCRLHFMLYQAAFDTTNCRIIKEFDKILTESNWKQITKAIQKLDFWSLKKEGDYSTLIDPDDIVVIGYRNTKMLPPSVPKFNYVHRLGLTWTSLGDLFILVLKLSGNKTVCP